MLLAAVLEYLVAEIWRLARDTTTDRTIGSRHLRRAVENNEELGELLIPHIDAIENAEDTEIESVCVHSRASQRIPLTWHFYLREIRAKVASVLLYQSKV